MQATKTLHGGFDLIRVIAIFLVIVVHVCGEFFTPMAHGWIAVNIYDSLAHICVPLFFILSGALIVPRTDSVGKTTERVLKLAIPLLFWSYVYLVWYRETGITWGYLWNFPAPRVWEPTVILSIIASPLVFHFWFIYAMIGLYMFVPVLQVFFQHSTIEKRVAYLIIWFIGSSCIPLLNHWSPADAVGVDLRYFASYAGYAFLGAVLADFVPSNRAAITLAAISFLCAIGAAYLTYLDAVSSGTPNEFFYKYHLPFMLVSAAAAFPVLSKLGPTLPQMFRNIVSSLSRATFGIYILHAIVLRYALDVFAGLRTIYPAISIPVLSITVFGTSAILVITLRQIPGVRRYLLPG
ncbi:acyltransferase family protein [Rhizobium sp. P44RR-XXIV]|uniref:acyltransferase n=1 Tax=Rhizobium sp. P44RR-XXIV TaxID=1921145 RepID=UPI00098770F1|nr:acyltransferase family protein [Rhizobium sp. P44RR-XXIV]TIX91312.1 hypothetical protein BSK43_010075 [Rhizobium sp. P44RR-XXIV]